MWKCLNCGAVNEQEFCTSCGMKRADDQQSPMQDTSEETKRTTNTVAKVLIISLIVLLVLLCMFLVCLWLSWSDARMVERLENGKNQAQQTAEASLAPKQSQKLFYADYDAFIENARNGLGVPEHLGITWQVGDPYLLEGNQELISVSFFENGEFVAAADCNAQTGEPARSIVPYTEPQKKTSGIDTKNVQYFTYRNAYGGFSVDVPTFLKKESSDSYSAYYVSADGSVTMDIGCWEAGNVFSGVNALYNHIKSGIAYDIGYDRKKDNWFVISGEDGGVVYYQYHILKPNGMACHFIITYPKTLEKEFDEIVTHIYHSFEVE